jgi:hypothetical protein
MTAMGLAKRRQARMWRIFSPKQKCRMKNILTVGQKTAVFRHTQ